MKIIAFEFTKINASKPKTVQGAFTVNTDVEFLSVEKEANTLLKDQDVVKINFIYTVRKELEDKKEEKSEPSILLEGTIIISQDKGKGDEFINQWKSKKIDENIKVPLFNFILRKCTPKAIALEDELNIPLHIPMPKVKAKK